MLFQLPNQQQINQKLKDVPCNILNWS